MTFYKDLEDSSRFYLTGETPNGFTFYGCGDMKLAHHLVKLGERLANEGKEIVETNFTHGFNNERGQYEGSIECKIRFRLKQAAKRAEGE